MQDLGKIRGLLFSAIIVAIYYKLLLPFSHKMYFGFDPQYGIGTSMIFYGLIMTQFLMMRSGEKVQLTFCGTPINAYWGWFGFLPNICHFTIFLGGNALLWGTVRRKNSEYEYEKSQDIHINVSDSNIKYNVNSTVPYWAAQLSRITGIILEFILVRWTKAPVEYKFCALGYVIYIIGIITVCLNSSVILAGKKLGQTFPSAATQAVINEKITVNMLLSEGQKPFIPPIENFVSLPHGNEGFYYIGERDSRKYYQFVEPAFGEVTSIVVKESLCAIVPPERKIRFYTKYPPTFVVNMAKYVEYTEKDEFLTSDERDSVHKARIVTGNNNMVMKKSTKWKTLYKEWYKVDTKENYSYIEGRGAKSSDVTPQAPGGLVCF